MKRYRIYTIRYVATLAMWMCAMSSVAQQLNSAYFVDGYAYGHELNPAKDYGHKGYFSLPVLPGHISVGIKGNLSLEDLLYKNSQGDGLVSYLHPTVSTSDALQHFSKDNKILSDLRYDILSAGFRGFGGYNTVTVGIHTNVGMNIPYELFELTKSLQNRDYDIRRMGITACGWAEVALGHSRQFSESLRLGGKAKLLLGIGYAKLNVNALNLDLQEADKWVARSHVEAEVGLKGFTWGKMETKNYHNPELGTFQQINFSNIDVQSGGLDGMGAALDLGLVWDLDKQYIIDGVKLSASLLDIGFIRWKQVSIAQNRGEDFVFDGFKNIKVNDDGTTFEHQLEDIGDRLTNLYCLQAMGTKGKSNMIGSTLNIGMEYAMPTRMKVNLGFLSTTRIQGKYGWNEERIAATLSPIRWIDLSGNICFGTFGCNMGWLVNVHPCGFNLFLGSDHCVGKFSKQGIPLRSTYDFTMGINFPMGLCL